MTYTGMTADDHDWCQASVSMLNLVEKGSLAYVVAKKHFPLYLRCFFACRPHDDPDDFALQYFTGADVIQTHDTTLMEEWVRRAIAAEPKAAADVQAGNEKAIGRLIGVAMKLSGGKSNPTLARAEIERQCRN